MGSTRHVVSSTPKNTRNLPTSEQEVVAVAGCLILVGDRKLRKELMLRNLFVLSDPIRPLHLERLSLLGDESLVPVPTEALRGDGSEVLGSTAPFSVPAAPLPRGLCRSPERGRIVPRRRPKRVSMLGSGCRPRSSLRTTRAYPRQ